jgi:hypothetical protein
MNSKLSLSEKTNEFPFPEIKLPDDPHGISVYPPKVLPI